MIGSETAGALWPAQGEGADRGPRMLDVSPRGSAITNLPDWEDSQEEVSTACHFDVRGFQPVAGDAGLTFGNDRLTESRLQEFIEEVRLAAERAGFLQGYYLVNFFGPIAQISTARAPLRSHLLEYIRRTERVSRAPESDLLWLDPQYCGIRKVHGAPNGLEISRLRSTRQ